MPNDAKLGLLVGVGLVITVAVVFFHKDQATAQPQEDAPPAAAVGTPAPAAAVRRGQYRNVKARPAARTGDTAARRRHTVQEGETLVSLAEHYYGDADKSDDIYRANRNVLKDPEQLAPGTELVIPELDASTAAVEADSGS